MIGIREQFENGDFYIGFLQAGIAMGISSIFLILFNFPYFFYAWLCSFPVLIFCALRYQKLWGIQK